MGVTQSDPEFRMSATLPLDSATALLHQRNRNGTIAAPEQWNETLATILNHRSVRGFLPDALPEGTLADGQVLKWWILQGGSGGYSLTPSSDFVLPQGEVSLEIATAVGSRSLLIGEYHAATGKVFLTGLLLFAPLPS